MINDGDSCLTLPPFLGKHEKTGVAKDNRELVTRESAHLGIHKKDTAEETEVRIASKIKSPKGRKKREKRNF